MATTEDILFRIQAQVNQAVSEINKVSGSTKKMGKSMEKAAKKSKKIEKSVDWKKLRNSVLGAAVAVYGFVRAISAAIAESNKEEKAIARLRNIMIVNNNATEAEVKSLIKLAGAMQDITGIGDELTISAQAMLGTFKFKTEEIKILTPRILDMRAAMEKATGVEADMESITIAVGKAFTSGIGSLTRYGVALTDAEKDAFNMSDQMGKIGVLAQVLDNNFKGSALAIGKTYAGQLGIAGAKLSDFQENMGTLAKIILADYVPAVNDAIDAMNRFLELRIERTDPAGLLKQEIKALQDVKKIRDAMSKLPPGSFFDETSKALHSTINLQLSAYEKTAMNLIGLSKEEIGNYMGLVKGIYLRQKALEKITKSENERKKIQDQIQKNLISTNSIIKSIITGKKLIQNINNKIWEQQTGILSALLQDKFINKEIWAEKKKQFLLQVAIWNALRAQQLQSNILKAQQAEFEKESLLYREKNNAFLDAQFEKEINIIPVLDERKKMTLEEAREKIKYANQYWNWQRKNTEEIKNQQIEDKIRKTLTFQVSTNVLSSSLHMAAMGQSSKEIGKYLISYLLQLTLRKISESIVLGIMKQQTLELQKQAILKGAGGGGGAGGNELMAMLSIGQGIATGDPISIIAGGTQLLSRKGNSSVSSSPQISTKSEKLIIREKTIFLGNFNIQSNDDRVKEDLFEEVMDRIERTTGNQLARA